MPPRSTRSRPDIDRLCEETLAEQLQRVDAMKAMLHVPMLRDHVMEHPGLHFHFHPDLVIGLEGASRFDFFHEHFVVGRGELALIPGGIPHRETPLPGPFRNLVVSVYNETVSVQVQDGETQAEYYDTPKYQQLAQYLDEIAELSHTRDPDAQLGIKGLLLIYLSTLEGVIRQTRQAPAVEKLKISQTKRLVQEHLGASELGVGHLAGLLHCSSDYLSHLFHRETGQRLTHYINVERVKAAMTMLRTTPLTIAEVAYAVGFESQGYFSRVFRQVAFKSPMAYRRSIEHSVVELEGRPRTIFAEGAG
jgi:AraC-like DNA-binding protein